MSSREKLLYTLEEAAEILGFQRKESAYQMIRRGQIPGVRFGRKWYVNGQKFRDLIAAGGTIDDGKGGAE